MRYKGLVPVALVIGLVVVGSLYVAGVVTLPKPAQSSTTTAPNFSLATIYGGNFTLSRQLTSSVVVIEFTSISCSECQVVERTLASLYSQYNATGRSNVEILSVYIEPSFGDTIPALKTYHTANNITWQMAQDTPTLAVSSAYGVVAIPDVIVVDKAQHPVYDVTGAQNAPQLQSSINGAVSGTAATISLVTVSVFALAILAGVSTFFSPCAFPMFPGYMSLYLGLNTNRAPADGTSGGSDESNKGTMRRALSGGGVAALGMLVVFLLIGVALAVAANAVGRYIPYLLVIVGIILLALGALLLTNLQYWRVVTPVQRLWQRISGASAEPAPIGPSADGQGLHLKLFSYGMGYAAAAAGCVFPVILSAVVAGLALGTFGGIVTILIYSLTAAALMVVVTLIVAYAGRSYVNQLKALTPVIKKVTAVALLAVGVYLIYFYYTAWIA